MRFIKLSNYAPIYNYEIDPEAIVDEFPMYPEEEDSFEKLVRETASGVRFKEEPENEVSEEVEEVIIEERDPSEIETSVFLLNCNEDNILYMRESDDLMNPRIVIVFITGAAIYVLESWEEILLAIAEATGEPQNNKLL